MDGVIMAYNSRISLTNPPLLVNEIPAILTGN